jgi:hypothetical protein
MQYKTKPDTTHLVKIARILKKRYSKTGRASQWCSYKGILFKVRERTWSAYIPMADRDIVHLECNY